MLLVAVFQTNVIFCATTHIKEFIMLAIIHYIPDSPKKQNQQVRPPLKLSMILPIRVMDDYTGCFEASYTIISPYQMNAV